MRNPTTGVSTKPGPVHSTLGSSLCDGASLEVAELTAAVSNRDVLIVASPTFKATYSGLLKLFLDHFGRDTLAGTVAVPLMTAASPAHALASDLHLRPLLIELGATVPTRSVFLVESTFDDLPAALSPWANDALPILTRTVGQRLPPS